jgi:hypothetical protein
MGGFILKRCIKCILPDTSPNIVFDDNGVCNFCDSYKKINYIGESKFRELLDTCKKDGNKYDCVVGVSGGRDSSYTLLKLTKDYGMKVLAVNYESPYTDPQATLNIDNAVKILGVDLIRFNLKNNIHERTFKHNLNSWLQKPSPATVPMMCIACKTILQQIIKHAKAHDVKCIVTGGNPYEDTSFKKELINVSADEGHENTFIKSLHGISSEIIKNPSYCHPTCIPVMITGFLYGNPYGFGPRIFASDIKFIDIFHYIPWKEDEVLTRIKNELNWESPSKLSSSWRFDCKIGHLKDLLYTRTLNMTEKDDFYSKMVRENLMTREEALARISVENELHFDEIQELLESSNVDVSYVEELLKDYIQVHEKHS